MTAIAPVITIDGKQLQVKAPCAKQWRKHCNGICWIPARYTAYWRWRHCTTMSISPLKMRWCPLASHLDDAFRLNGRQHGVITEGEDVSGEIRTQEVANAASGVAAFPHACVKRYSPPTRIPRSAGFNRRWTRYAKGPWSSRMRR